MMYSTLTKVNMMPQRSKYGAVKTTYNGRIFDSKKESEFAMELDILRKAKRAADRVLSVEYQVPYEFQVNRTHVFTYIADFRVTYADGHQMIFDVKGYKKGAAYQMFKIKKKCIEAHYQITITEV